MVRKFKGLLIVVVIGLFLTSSVFAGQAVRVGLGLPNGMFGEYEYKVLMDQIGIYGNLGMLDGEVSTLGGNSSDVKLSSWSVGARVYLPLGFHIKGGYSNITAEGKATDAVTQLEVDAKAEVSGFDVGLGYEMGIGPVFIGLDGGMIFAAPSISTDAPNELTGGLFEMFDIESVPYVKVFLGLKF